MATPHASSSSVTTAASPPRSNLNAANNGSALTIPGVFDTAYFSTPDVTSVLVHTISSSSQDDGFQAIVCLHSRPDVPAHLGLPALPNYEDKAFLQVSPENETFVLQTDAPRHRAMQVTVMEYLILLQFVGNDWPRLKSKLNGQLITMREGTDPVFMTGYLLFYNHGASHFRVSLSSRLVFKACVESRDPEHKIKAWLERRPDTNLESAAPQEMPLPMNSLTILSQDTNGIKILVDHLSAYKSRSRKRNKAVLS